MKSKRAFKLKQVKIHKKLNDLLKKYIEDKKVMHTANVKFDAKKLLDISDK